MRNKHVCDLCGKSGATTHLVTRSYGKGSRLLVVEDIPVVSCPRCGGSYMTAEVLHSLERIKLHRKGIAVKRPVAVASYN